MVVDIYENKQYPKVEMPACPGCFGVFRVILLSQCYPNYRCQNVNLFWYKVNYPDLSKIE